MLRRSAHQMTASVLQRLGSVDDCLVATLKRKGLGRWCVFTQGTQQVQGRYFGATRRVLDGSKSGPTGMEEKKDEKSIDLILVGSGILGLAMLANAAGVFGGGGGTKQPSDTNGATDGLKDSVVLSHDDDDKGEYLVHDEHSHDDASSTEEVQKRHDDDGRKEEEDHGHMQQHNKQEEEKEDGVTILDSHHVLGSIESVLTKSADTMLQEDADNVSTNETTQEQKEEEEKEEDKKEEDSHAAVHDATATMSAISSAMADTAGESVASSIIGMSREAAAPSSEADEKKEPKDSPKIEAPTAIVSDATNISASQLLQMASMYEEEGNVMWESFPARHRQAEADAKTLTLLLKETKDAYDRELQRLHSKAKKFKATLENLEHMQHELLEAQAATLHIDHEKNITRERVKRQEVLDSARIQLDSLSVALSRQSERAKKSQEAHKMSSAVFHIRDALEHGRDFSASVEYLKSLDDKVANIALENITTDRPIKTRHVLLSEFEKRVKRPAMELSYIPQGEGGGMMTSLVAKIANALKIDNEDDTMQSFVGTIEQGDILEAAEQVSKLVEGTVAAHAIRDWLHDVKTSCAAAQALKILDARAACLSSPYHNH
ncbi:hypothetical protein PSENEW3n2_00000700 [Picochlorum sp. SENEW3]|nr:hypothetical protein PSENEW3n2_00000700 [Picochlorum sp. SENEW3]WPT15621.1 hypothetical protein PSENEW3_00000700 [Picochlorum sp. SENEW3]